MCAIFETRSGAENAAAVNQSSPMRGSRVCLSRIIHVYEVHFTFFFFCLGNVANFLSRPRFSRDEEKVCHHLIIQKKKVRTDNGRLADLECDASLSRIIVLLKTHRKLENITERKKGKVDKRVASN